MLDGVIGLVVSSFHLTAQWLESFIRAVAFREAYPDNGEINFKGAKQS
jgi:hypothetical protein